MEQVRECTRGGRETKRPVRKIWRKYQQQEGDDTALHVLVSLPKFRQGTIAHGTKRGEALGADKNREAKKKEQLIKRRFDN